MSAPLTQETMPQPTFSAPTARLLEVIGVQCLAALPDLPIESLVGYDHIISDVDGVAQPYGGEVSKDVEEWYRQLVGRLSFVSLNPKLQGMKQFLGAPLYLNHPTLQPARAGLLV